MDRRKLLRDLGAGTVALSLGATAWSKSASTPSNYPASAASTRNWATKIIGVGGAGCNFIDTIRASLDPHKYANRTELVCIDLGAQNLPPVESLDESVMCGLSLKTVSLALYGAGGRVNTARAAALRNIDLLNAAVNGAGTVILVAGLGGGTGSGILPIIARLAQDSGAVTIAIVVMPFDFEGLRNAKAKIALSSLERELDLVMPFSNQELGNSMGDGALLSDIYSQQEQRIIATVRRLTQV